MSMESAALADANALIKGQVASDFAKAPDQFVAAAVLKQSLVKAGNGDVVKIFKALIENNVEGAKEKLGLIITGKFENA